MPQRERFFHNLLFGSAPLIVWALHFFAAYALIAASCCTAVAAAPWFGTPALRVVLWLLSAAALTVVAALLAHAIRQPAGLTRSAGAGAAVLALTGVAWTTLALASPLPLCECR